MTLEHILIVNPTPSYVHNTGLRFIFDYFPRRKQTVATDNVPKPQDTFSCTFNPRGTWIPVLFEVNMKGRKPIPHIRHQAEYNLVINPTKQRKCPFPYRNDIIIPEALIGLLPVWFYTNMFSICAILMGNLEQSVYYVYIYMNRRLLSSPPFPSAPSIYPRPLYSHIRYALLIFLQPLYTDEITHN